jgi:endonuclease YncB( thermonuclease family)
MPERTRLIEASLSNRRIALRRLFPLPRSCRMRQEAASRGGLRLAREAERTDGVNVMRASTITAGFQCARRAKIALGAILLAAATADPAIAAGCAYEPQGEGRVAAIMDARSFRLEDGREVILAGIEPAASDKTADSRAPALAAILAGRDVELRGSDDTPDRYGRQPAFVFLAGSETLVQGELLARGEALVSATVTDNDCAASLTGAEAVARQARRGIWASSSAIKNPESPGDILAGIGRFTVVEGKVLSVRQAGATTYLNFGRNWTRDFAVTIARRMLLAFEAAGMAPKSFENQRIRVRGWVEARGGPRIEVLRVGQIELLGAN